MSAGWQLALGAVASLAFMAAFLAMLIRRDIDSGDSSKPLRLRLAYRIGVLKARGFPWDARELQLHEESLAAMTGRETALDKQQPSVIGDEFF